jgi:CRISPR/Cas system-associated exonuclease Cas4 (RecB family)
VPVLQKGERMTPAEILQTRWWDLKKSRIRVGNVLSTRASSLGHPCERFLFYERTANHMRQPHDASLQAIFDLGNHLEKYVLREIEDMGHEVVESQRDLQDARFSLTGHIDCRVVIDGKRYPTEIKGLNPYTADTIRTALDIRDNRSIWVRKYYAQLQIYLLMGGDEAGMFALLNKCSGQIAFIDCALEYDYAEALLKKAERIQTAVASKTAPPRVEDTRECERCAFAHVCNPDIQFGDAPEVIEDPEIEAALRRRAELEVAAREFLQVDDEVKKKLANRAHALCGDFVITGKTVQRKSYTVEAGSYWQSSIKRFSNPKGSQ